MKRLTALRSEMRTRTAAALRPKPDLADSAVDVDQQRLDHLDDRPVPLDSAMQPFLLSATMVATGKLGMDDTR